MYIINKSERVVNISFVLYIVVLYNISIYTFTCVLQPKHFPFYQFNTRMTTRRTLGYKKNNRKK